jgi:fungal STAND N-terminal Goodbye domain
VNTSIFFMSSTGQATSSTSNFQFIIDAALADYTKITGTDLSNTPFATAIQQSNSPEAILQLLHEREKSFKEYRDGNRKLISCLTPAVKVFQALSGILGDAVNQVSRSCHPVTLLTVTSSDPTPTGKRLVCCH